MEIVDATADTIGICERVLRALPGWFGIEESIVDYVRDVGTLPTFVVVDDTGEPFGFLTLKLHGSYAAEIHVMGVLPGRQRKGAGKALVDRAERWLRERGFEYLQVKTLSPSRESEEYAATRAFYEACGFRPLEELTTLWGEANPCLQYIKKIQ